MIPQRNTPPAAAYPSALEQIADSLTPETINGGMAVGPSNGYDSFLGLDKFSDSVKEWNQNRKENFEDWNERRIDRKEERRDKRDKRFSSRIERKNIKAQSKAELREAKAEGIKTGNFSGTGKGLLNVADSVAELTNSIGGSAANKLFLGGEGLAGGLNAPMGAEPYPSSDTYSPNSAEGSGPNKNFIIIGVIVLVMVVAAMIFIAKRKG